MFVPIEPAFLLAIQEDGELWHYAYERQILLVGPTTLLFVIRVVDNLWRQELQARSVKDVIKRGTALYEKFAGFVADIEAIGKSLRGATESYEDAKNKLTSGPGNLIRQWRCSGGLGLGRGSLCRKACSMQLVRGVERGVSRRGGRERRGGVGLKLPAGKGS